MDRKLVSNLLGISEKSYYRWKENRAIFKLLEMYFSDKNIEEFLETGKIEKFENITFIVDKYLYQLQTTYLNSFEKSQSLLSEPQVHDRFKDFYFNFLSDFGKINFPFNINALGIQPLLTHYLYQYQTREIKKSLDTNNINQKLENKKSEIEDAIVNSSGKLKKDLEELKKGFQEEIEKKEIIDDIFSKNEKDFELIILHFNTFTSWNNDIYYFLELVKKDDFNYFINSKNDELLYQGIGYLVYSLSHNLDAEEKLQIIYSTFHYFIFNKDLISSTNIKKQILKRLENNDSFSEIDKEIGHKYITSPFPDNHTNNFDINSEKNEIEIINFEDL
ncbi:hypothetical protein D3M61_11350 [Aliarcobacter butzleri]|uniref:hypothetical protein n=1 Tax=Aliarcobacter butzleri TaxID=28197 RepID=UPI00102E0A06|nr:hypothetical protein [Aliarcobacter butzleri]RZV12743.1 hypothetical protein D3M61_11350 [Aliarcobacter butzleri]